MPKYNYLTGVLGALPAFESASRHLSFTKAANELSLSQPAISRRISGLESRLGASLFVRKHNSLQLTAEGKNLLSAMEISLGHLDKVLGQISSHNKKNRLTIACGFSFASMWLQPRFTRLRQKMDGTEFHLISTETLDSLNSEMIDIRILWENKPWPNRDVRPLFSQHVFPVCSPEFALTHNLSCNDSDIIERLTRLPLLQCGSGGPADILWEQWFNLHNTPYTDNNSDYIFDNFQYMVQGALDSEGIALAYHHLIEPLLKQGSLIQIGPTVLGGEEGAWIEFDPVSISIDQRDQIYDWFRDETA